jgi:hypothetical protein
VLQRRGVKEIGGLLVLFFLLIAFAAFYEQVGQERVASNAPTTVNVQADGVRALYLLYGREGIRTEALKNPWSDLGSDDGLLVFVEPPASDRPLDREDIKVLERWLRAGGTLLDLVADPPVDQPLDPSNTVTGDCGATAGSPVSHDVPVEASTASPLLHGVQSLFVSSRQRLTLAKNAPYTVLARDSDGAVAVDKPLGKGRVILVANRYGATNAGISRADNAVFLVNVARRAASDSNRVVRFDEYHHGIGFAQKTAAAGGLWGSIPLPWRLGCLHLLAAGLLLLYNGNRRFGPARVITPISMRASTDYVNSMARLYRRAGAADIAVETLYLRLLRDLRRVLDVPSDTGIAQVARAAQQKFGPPADGLQELLLRGEAVVAGQRLTEPDMLNLARQIEHFRRICELVGV